MQSAVDSLRPSEKNLQCTAKLNSLTTYTKTRISAIAVIAARTACSILTLFIVIATSRPLNKKIRLLSVRGSNNYCGSASAICSPHISAAPAVAPCDRSRHLVIVDKGAVPFDSQPESHRHLWRFSLRFL